MSESSSEHRDSTKESSSSGVSSDLSDSDEIDERSKIFVDFHTEEASTQTAILEEQKSEITQLTMEIEKLAKFKNVIETRSSPDHVSYEELDDLRVSEVKKF